MTRNTIIKQYCNCVVKVLVKVGTSISAVYYDLPLTSWLPALPVSSAVPPSLMCGQSAASRWFIDNIDMFEAITINKAAAAAVEMKY